MKPKRLPQFIIVLTLVLFVVGGVFAVSAQVNAFDLTLQLDYPLIPGTPGTLNDIVADLTIPGFIIWLFQTAIWIGALAALLMLIYVGFQFATSGGNPMKRTVAKDRLKGVALGVVILTSSFFLLNTINPELTSLRFLQEGACRPGDEVCEKEFGFEFDVEDAVEASSGLVIYEKNAFGGNSHTVISNVKNAYVAFSEGRTTTNGALKSTGRGSDVGLHSLKLSPGCAVGLYDEANYGGAYILVRNNGVAGEATVYDEFGVLMGSGLDFHRDIPLEASSKVLLLSYIKDFKIDPAGSNNWTDDVGSIKFEIDADYLCDGRKGLILYNEEDFTGRQQVFLEDSIDLRSEFIGHDLASSLKIVGDLGVTVYELNKFKGLAMRIEKSGGTMTCENFTPDDSATPTPCTTALLETGQYIDRTFQLPSFSGLFIVPGNTWENDIASIKVSFDVAPSSTEGTLPSETAVEIKTFGIFNTNGDFVSAEDANLESLSGFLQDNTVNLKWEATSGASCLGVMDGAVPWLTEGSIASATKIIAISELQKSQGVSFEIYCEIGDWMARKDFILFPIMGPAPPPSGGSGGFDVDFWLFFRTDGGEFRGGGQFLPTSLSAITDSAGDMRFGWEATNTNAECRLHNVGSGGGILENDLPSGGESIIRNIQVPVGSDKLILKIVCSVGGEEERSQSIYVLR